MSSHSHSKTALITGASAGIGYALAKEAAKQGYNLVLVARREDKLRELAAKVSAEYGVHCTVLPHDLSKDDTAELIVAELKEKKIHIDMLINNAGLGVFGMFWETDWQKEQEVLQVNVLAAVKLTRLLLEGMIKKKSGVIMNICSTAAFQPGPLMPMYYASKAFMLSFSESLATQLEGTGVRLTVVCPGPVHTDFAVLTGGDDVNGKVFIDLGMSPEEVAISAFNGVRKHRVVVIPGLKNIFGTWIPRFLPRDIMRKLMKRGQEFMR
jgi:short-subunit dehydrogenase